jgi:2-amino-4-hydroxy-6-hydroxymethyldihydropteridine diphosphokinase
MVTAYVGLGSNLGDRIGNLSRAIDAIAHIPETRVSSTSRAYESVPAYHGEQPAFVNAVAEVETGLTADGLLNHLGRIEAEMGRVREVENGPRVIDLDLLLFGDEERASEMLTLPHPRLKERDFVVTPLLEIAPRVKLPDGRHPKRSEATVGPVIRDLGQLPDAGVGHNMPIEETDWVTIAQSEGPQSAIGGFDAQVQFKRQVLDQEGIPYAFEPFEPGLDMDIIGPTRTFKLGIPAEYEERVLALFESLEEAAPPGVETEASEGTTEGTPEAVAAERDSGTT